MSVAQRRAFDTHPSKESGTSLTVGLIGISLALARARAPLAANCQLATVTANSVKGRLARAKPNIPGYRPLAALPARPTTSSASRSWNDRHRSFAGNRPESCGSNPLWWLTQWLCRQKQVKCLSFGHRVRKNYRWQFKIALMSNIDYLIAKSGWGLHRRNQDVVHAYAKRTSALHPLRCRCHPDRFSVDVGW